MTRRRRVLWLTAALLGFTVLLTGWTVESIMLSRRPAALPPVRHLEGGTPGRAAVRPIPSPTPGAARGTVVEIPVARPVFPASPLPVPRSSSLGGGVEVPVTGCPGQPVHVSYVSRFTATPSPGYKVVGVHLSALDNPCHGSTVTVRLGSSVRSSVPYAPGELDVPFADGNRVLAQDVFAVDVTLS